MTEADKVETTNGSGAAAAEPNGCMSDLDKSINHQISYYFGDWNLPRDKFLQEQLKNNEDGWISIDVMLKFQRLNKLCSDGEQILKALQKSDEKLIEVDLEKKQLRRNPELPIPEREDDDSRKAKTVYCKGFEKVDTTLDNLLAFFKKYDNVINVTMRTYQDKRSKNPTERHFKGSVFVCFKDKASAEAFMALESVKNPEDTEELIRKWQSDYFDEKQKEFEEKKAQRNSERKAKEKILMKQEEKEEEKAEPEENTL